MKYNQKKGSQTSRGDVGGGGGGRGGHSDEEILKAFCIDLGRYV